MLLENNNASISVNVRESIFRNLGTFCLWNQEYCALDSGIQLKETRITLMIAIRNTSSIDKESWIPNPVPWNPESTAWNPETKIKRENCLFMASKVRNCWKLMLSEGWKCYFRDPTFQNLTGEHDPGPRSSSRLVIDPPPNKSNLATALLSLEQLETGRFDTNSSCEIAQKFCPLQV